MFCGLKGLEGQRKLFGLVPSHGGLVRPWEREREVGEERGGSGHIHPLAFLSTIPPSIHSSL